MAKPQYEKVFVKSKKDGFRRAGIAFSASVPTEVDLSELSEDERKALLNDPNLLVSESGGSADNSAAVADLQKKDDEIKALANTLAGAGIEISTLKADKDELEKSFKEQSKELAEAKKEVKSLQDQVTDLNEKLKAKAGNEAPGKGK